MTAQSFTPSVGTTFLPKTNGMVFGERLQARADKGRVYLLHGADPVLPLEIVSGAVLSGGSLVGGELVCTPPTVTGGIEPYGYIYQWSVPGDSSSDTLLLTDDHIDETIQCTVTVVDAAGDTIDSTSNSIGPIKLPFNVNSSISISGQPYAGEELACGEPSVSGGTKPYTTTYTWSNGAPGNTYELQNSDVGNNITCTVKVVDADSNSQEVVTNSIGPIGQYTLGTVNATINGVEWTSSDLPDEVPLNSEALLVLGMSGNSPNITYTWEVRNGAARLSDQGGGSNYVIFTDSGFVSIQGNALEPFASDSTGQSCRFEFIVSN